MNNPNDDRPRYAGNRSAFKDGVVPPPQISTTLENLFRDRGTLVGIVLLFVPVARIVGAFMLVKRFNRYFRISSKYRFWVFVVAMFLLAGGLGEVLGLFKKLMLPLTILAAAVFALMLFLKYNESKYDEYLSFFSGRDAVEIDSVCAALGVSEARLFRDIKSMRSKKLLPSTVYIDRANRLLVLTEAGRPAQKPHAAPAQKEPEPAPKAETAGKPDDTSAFDAVLKEIRRLNDEIAHEELSRKIDHIERTTARIFQCIRQHPERAGEIQTFLEYYLPTTLKLLSRYAELEQQGTDVGDNIRQSKLRIESVMDKIVEGFDLQLDRLFKSEAVDITADVNALDKMMKMEGLRRN